MCLIDHDIYDFQIQYTYFENFNYFRKEWF